MIEQSVSLASNGVVKVPGYEQLVRFGYTKNRGVYRLAVTATGEWEGLTIRCFWHVPDGKDPASSLVEDGYVAVPASVTAQPGNGCITFEGSDGTKTVTSADLRYRVSANSGTEDGTEPEPGTPSWQQLVDAVHTDATAAEQAKTDAQTAAQQSEASAQKAAQTAASASRSAQAAAGSLQELKNGIASGNFKGEPGTSPTVTVQDITGGHRIIITDATGTNFVDVLNGKKGDPGKPGDVGATPELTIGTVEEGDAPSATITGTAKNPVLNLTLKSGAPGKDATVDATLTHDGEAADAKATGDAISAVKVRQNILVGTETGNPIAVDDAFPAPLCGLTVYGKSTQDGTPTPDAPVPIVSAGDGGSVAVKVTGRNLFYKQGFQEYFINSVADSVGLAVGNVSSVLQVVTGAKYYVTRNKIGTKFRVAVVDKLPTKGSVVRPSSAINADSKRQVEISATSKYMVIQCEDEAAFSELMVSLDSSTTYSPYREQLLTLLTPNGLLGIPVTSGGNYTDQSGQQWVCDEVDLESGMRVQRVDKAAFDSTKPLAEQNAMLATPIEKPLTPAEIAAYKALTAYAPDTVVQAGDGAGIRLDYQRDVNLVVKNLEDAIASMT